MTSHTQAFHVGTTVRVFCRAADAWFDGWVADAETPGLVTVHFQVDGELHRKNMLAASDCLQTSSRLGSGEHDSGSPAVCDMHMVDEADPDATFANKIYTVKTFDGGFSKHSLGISVNLAAESVFKDRLMTGEVLQVDKTLEIMDCTVIDTQSSILELIGIGDEGSTAQTYPWHLGHLVGVTEIGNYSAYARTEKTQHVSLCLVRSTFCTEISQETLTISDKAERSSTDDDKSTWHVFHGTHFVKRVFFGGLIDLNVKVTLVQQVDDSQAVLGTVSNIIAETFKNTVENKDRSRSYLRSALSEYEELVRIKVTALSSGVTPEAFGMQFSLTSLIDQVKEFRTEVDKLPHDPNKCTVVGIGVESAQGYLRKSLPGVALSLQDELMVFSLLKRACESMYDINFFLASLGKCKGAVQDFFPWEAYCEIERQIKYLRQLRDRLTGYIHSGVVHILEGNFPGGVELNEEQKKEFDGLMGKGNMSATEFVGRAHPDNLCYSGYIFKGEAICRGTVIEQDGSVWASGGVTYLQSWVNASIDRHKSYPVCMDVYKLASKKSQTMGACTGRRTSGLKHGVNANNL